MEQGIESSIQVLVVEDNPGDAGLIEEYLIDSRNTTFDSKIVVDLSTAAEALSSRDFDVVLLDLNLPDSLGLDTVARMNKMSKDAAIIVLTGLSDDLIGYDAIKKGAQDFLVKGNITSDLLERTIRYSMERKKSERLSSAVNDISSLVSSALDFHSSLNEVLERSARALGGKASSLALLEEDGWYVRYAYRIPEDFLSARMDVSGMGIPGPESMGPNPIVIEDGVTGTQVKNDLAKRIGAEAFLIAPLTVKGHTLGLLAVFFDCLKKFSNSEIDFAKKMGLSLSLAMENARLYELEKAQRSLLQAVTDNVPALIFIIEGKDYRVKWTNLAFQKQAKIRAPNLNIEKLKLGDVLGNMDDSGVSRAIGEVVSKKETKLVPNFKFTTPGHEETHWQVGAVPLPQPSGSVDVLVLAVDVSDIASARRQIEELAAKANEERIRLRAILDTLPVGVIIADNNGKIAETNQIMIRIWGGKGGMPKGITDLKAFKGWWADTGMSVRPEQWGLARAIRKGETSIGEVVDIQRFDGVRGTILNSAAPIRDNQGSIIGALAITQEITHQRQLEQEAVEAKMQAEFYLDILSQDINTLNANAVGFLETALEHDDLEERQKTLLAESLGLLEDSSKLIQTVSKIQQVESQDTKHGLVDVGWLLEDVKEEILKGVDDEVAIRYTPAIKKMVIGGELLRDAFSNIIDNSIKYSSGKVEIDITLGKMFDGGREYYKIGIEDNGPGIPDDMKSKVFLRRQRGNPKSAGSNLGFYLVRRVVEAFNGRVWVEDRVPGDYSKGARFVVLLPVASAI